MSTGGRLWLLKTIGFACCRNSAQCSKRLLTVGLITFHPPECWGINTEGMCQVNRITVTWKPHCFGKLYQKHHAQYKFHYLTPRIVLHPLTALSTTHINPFTYKRYWIILTSGIRLRHKFIMYLYFINSLDCRASAELPWKRIALLWKQLHILLQ